MEKIYEAPGMIDWQMSVVVGRAIVRITFSGGGAGGAGLIPASFATSDSGLQKIIEQSEHFARGRVKIKSRR